MVLCLELPYHLWYEKINGTKKEIRNRKNLRRTYKRQWPKEKLQKDIERTGMTKKEKFGDTNGVIRSRKFLDICKIPDVS